MRVIALTFVALAIFIGIAFGDVYVHGYNRSDGSYVEGHMRSSPNSSQYDNYSSKGNYNPYTGERGTVNPNPSFTPFSHQQQYKSIY